MNEGLRTGEQAILDEYHKEMKKLAVELAAAMKWSAEYIQSFGGTENVIGVFSHAEHQVSDYPDCEGAAEYERISHIRNEREKYYNDQLRQLIG